MKKVMSVLVIVALLLGTAFYVNYNVIGDSKSPNIVYITEKTEIIKSVKYPMPNGEKKQVNIKLFKDKENIKSDQSIIWIDYDYLATNKKYISLISNLIESNVPVIFIKDNISRKEIIDMINLNTEALELKNVGNSLIQAVKVEKVGSDYLFTNININQDDKSDESQRYYSLVMGSISNKVKKLHLSEKTNSSIYDSSVQGLTSLPDTTSDYTYTGANGATYSYTDVTVEVAGKIYRYNNNPLSDGKYVSINVGDFSVVHVFGTSVKYFYTYVNTPSSSTVVDYSPRNGTTISSGNSTTLGVSSPFFGISFTSSVDSYYALDSGGMGSAYVQLKANKKNWGVYDTVGPGECLETLQSVEYKNTSDTRNGSLTFTSVGATYNRSDGFYLQ